IVVKGAKEHNLKDVSVEIPRNKITVFTGLSGSGKSSFLRVLLGNEEPTTGRVVRADNLLVSYFDQSRTLLDLEATPTSYLAPKSEWVDFQGRKLHVRSYLEKFLFASNQMEMPIRQLSGGERARLSLAALMLEPCQVLVLDEPTNDLDRETLTVLQECLESFEGALLLVSHDRFFLEQVCDRFLAFSPARPGQTEWFSSMEQWEDWRSDEVALGAQMAKDAAKKAQADAKAAANAPKKLSYNDQREYDQMEAKIQDLETSVEKLTAEVHNPETQKELKKLTELTGKLSKTQTELDQAYARWSVLEAMVKGIAANK
ncbi:MAG: ATP-binding cassette domain-containing protein, partial [Proteobacteria bacterium]